MTKKTVSFVNAGIKDFLVRRKYFANKKRKQNLIIENENYKRWNRKYDYYKII